MKNNWKVVIIGFLTVIITNSCQSENRTTDTYSYEFDSKTEKLQFLKEYLKKDAGLVDANYHIWYQDNGTGMLPAPSDYKIKVALKIEADSLDSWIKNLKPTFQEISLSHWKDLKLDSSKWSLKETPEFYVSESLTEIKILYRKEHIILGVYATMPVALD
ncbi:hypothetical protein [Ascidiimonas sp. W6]|uniref:hypothetical protein n=1 Tax=Ascidiimonas meishanensis TaxID=3128903 RepID=UPI0030ED6C6A